MIVAFITLIFMILIHEFGHFSIAKMLHVPVYEFAVGMGPKIFSKKGKSETVYSLRCIPVGGFCSFDKSDVTGIQDSALNKQPAWKRILILFGGSGFNLISAFIAAIIVCMAIGLPHATTTIAAIADEKTDSFLMEDDKILAVDDIEVREYEQLSELLNNSSGKVNITVLRNGEEITSDISLIEYGSEWKMGVQMYAENITSSPKNAINDAFAYCIDTAASIFKSLGGLFSGSIHINDMSGIVGIVSSMSSAAQENIRNILSYFIMISINLGIVNLLPIPVLDGSKIIFCFIEVIFKKKLKEKTEENITLLFAILLIALMLYLTAHDIFLLIR